MAKSPPQNSVHQFFRFGFVGIFNSLIDFLVFTLTGFLLERFITKSDAFYIILIPTILGFLAGTTSSYFINRTWTFGQQCAPSPKEAARFYSVNAVSCILSALLITFLCNHVFTGPLFLEDILPAAFPLAKVYGKLCAIPIVIGVNFFGSKFIAFRKDGENPHA